MNKKKDTQSKRLHVLLLDSKDEIVWLNCCKISKHLHSISVLIFLGIDAKFVDCPWYMVQTSLTNVYLNYLSEYILSLMP